MRRSSPFAALAALALAAAARPAAALPGQFVPVNDPVADELRVLDLFAPVAGEDRVRLPHLGSGPWQWLELQGGDAARPRRAGARGLTLARIEREMAREAAPAFGAEAPRGTARALAGAWPDGTRAELSVALEGTRTAARAGGRTTQEWADGSGLHARVGFQVDRWVAYSHLSFGEWKGVRAFSDALVAGTDLAADTDESYLAYSAGPAWSVQFGRDRWSWGPGADGSLLLSRTSAPLDGDMLHVRLAPLRADASILNATVEPGTGEQLAAHRLEWAPRDGVRLGLAEAARYHASGWQGVYVAGVIPYSIAQRLLDREHPDSTGALRNNVMMACDASVRVAPGSRLYGELMIDDLHAKTATVPNKWATQAGWDGVGEVDGTRVTWNCEYAWASRWVYTSYYGRAYAAGGVPLGLPTGPGSRRLRARVAWDPGVAWQAGLVATRTETGREGLGDAFVPGGPVPDPASLAGPVERTESLEGFVRWWPATGADLSLHVANDRTANAAHVAGASARAWRAAFALRLAR